MSNSLLTPSTLPFELPDYQNLSDEDFAEAIEIGMAEQLAALRELAGDPEPATVQNVLEAWERSGATLGRALSAFWVAKAADTNPDRDAIDEDTSPKLAAHADAMLLDSTLYDCLRALAQRRDAGEVELDAQSAYLLRERLRDYERGGIHLGADDQDRLRQLNAELASLSTSYEQKLVAGRNAAAVHVTDVGELEGLSPAEQAEAQEAADRVGLGGWLLTVTNTTGQPLLASLHHRPLRERLFKASVSRGLGGEHDTRSVLVRIARLRDERARLLGHAHHAASVAEDGCAGSSEAVNDMLTRLAAGAVVNAEREAERLALRFAEIAPGERFAAWDWQYVAEIVQGEELALDQSKLRPYLEFGRVLHDGVFAAATQLYGVTFHLREDLVGYTPVSQTFEVRESDGTVLGAMVIDPYTRPSKQGGAWMTSIVDQSTLLGQAPVVTNTCNFPPPAAGQPSLLSWDNVITLFHEFGHDLHGLLSDVRYPSRSGTAVPRDFVEFPSQVNEIWAWQPSLLAAYARHHETGEPMPTRWVDQLVASRQFGTGYASVELLTAMLLDQAWHQSSADDLPETAEEVERFEKAALSSAGIDLELIPPRYRSAYFHHIFGGGYSAAYYSYMWSEVMDADTVAWFAENGMLNREAGEHFRRTLLAPGGSVDAMETYRSFRGDEPNLRHLLARLGIE